MAGTSSMVVAFAYIWPAERKKACDDAVNVEQKCMSVMRHTVTYYERFP
jgi:hypothetical protein